MFDAAPENERDGPNQAEAQAQKVRKESLFEQLGLKIAKQKPVRVRPSHISYRVVRRATQCITPLRDPYAFYYQHLRIFVV